MVADALAERWGLGRPRERYRGRIAEGRVVGVPLTDVPVTDAPLAGAPGVPGADRPAAGASEAARGPAIAFPAGPRVALLWPQTYMNDAGRSAGPARGALHVPLRRVLVVHDEIDIPFGEVRARLGGGLAGHNGLKSLRRELGGPDFVRVRVGVGRPASSDPEIVSAHVLGRFREDPAQVRELIERAADRVQEIVLGAEPV
jgi:PTH1 family peptidyl-tRNA hydrolase